jgi:hypothetical protein
VIALGPASSADDYAIQFHLRRRRSRPRFSADLGWKPKYPGTSQR